MDKRILFLIFIVAASAFANAAPSVWEQMRQGSVSSDRGIVKSVEIVGSDIYFKVQTKDAFGDSSTTSVRLCRSIDGGDDHNESEEVRAALLKSKVDLLQDARRSGKAIEFSTQGAWSPCVSALRSFET